MKKVAITLLILTFCAMAYAGPERYSGKEMKQVAPVPVAECPNWTGFYVGGFGGYKFAPINSDLNLFGDWNDGFPEVSGLESAGSENLDSSGAEAGSLIGYNYQWHNWVFGAEAAGGYLWLRDSNQTGILTNGGNRNTYDVSTSFKTHYLATFSPRIGYAFCKWMPYITGGLAVGDLDFFQQINEHDTFFREGGSHSENNAGWFVGGGLQYAITHHWSVRGQYQYVDLGSVSFDHKGTSPFPGFIGHSEAELREHNVSLAVIFQF